MELMLPDSMKERNPVVASNKPVKYRNSMKKIEAI
jgi:hypothetical protein